MATNAIDPNLDPSAGTDGEAQFNVALDSSTELTDAEFTDQLVSGAVTVAGQMIIMPKANEMLNEAMSDE
ncbi:hypothetical protein SOM59_04875 [Pseudomonas coleopterorum]|uniref:hypothetical protein n=1 Tax=Pseudomonas coleopterorum TaxID=1605838 RepID=UPI0017876B78|nr:hypothetical protein [Pseudomonas coleopterorum]MBD8480236.1 hypothetical protein [Pseudomonas coleopterorum]MDY1016417.1 hypothetical protein [Pseudomonas coleopterorum]